MKFISNSKKETQQFAQKLSLNFKKGGVFALTGNLGAGKTTFVQGFAKGLRIKSKIISPTFVLMKEYNLPFQADAKLFHIDLYRLEGKQNSENLGLDDIFANQKNIILIEWAEKLTSMPKNKITTIHFEFISDSKRKITIVD